MGLFGSGMDYAAQAAKTEKQRQGLINTGLGQINAIFGGGTVPFYTPQTSGFTHDQWVGGPVNNTYYTLGKKGTFDPVYAPNQRDKMGFNPTGSLFDPSGIRAMTSIGQGDIVGLLTGGLFGFGNKPLTPRQNINKLAKSNNLFTMDSQSFEGFQPDFYKGREKAYLDYAMPELGEQYRTNRDAILYGLANRGLLRGSVQKRASSDLERATGKGRQTIAESAINQSNQLRQSVEQARQNAIQQLYTSSNPSQALQSAISSAGSLRTPNAIAPLTDMFSNLARQYYTNMLYNNYRTGSGGPDANDSYSLPSAPVSY